MESYSLTDIQQKELDRYFPENNSMGLPEYEVHGIETWAIIKSIRREYLRIRDEEEERYNHIENLKHLLFDYNIKPSRINYFHEIDKLFDRELHIGISLEKHYSQTTKQYVKDLINLYDFQKSNRTYQFHIKLVSQNKVITLKSEPIFRDFRDNFYSKIIESAENFHKNKDRYQDNKFSTLGLPIKRKGAPVSLTKHIAYDLNKSLLLFIKSNKIDYSKLDNHGNSKFNKSPETFVHDFLVSCDLLKYILKESYEESYSKLSVTSSYTNKKDFCKKNLFEIIQSRK